LASKNASIGGGCFENAPFSLPPNGEPGQSIRPAGKVAGRSPLHAGSHWKVAG
jgi:hypothetical protein